MKHWGNLMAASDDEKLKAIAKVLGEPVAISLDSELAKTRLRLLVVSSLSLAIVYFDLHIGAHSTILGLRIENLSDEVVRTILTVALVYLYAHFLWGAMDGLREWKLRLTGLRYLRPTHSRRSLSEGWEGAPDAEHPTDPRQSTLYNWWKEWADSQERHKFSEHSATFLKLAQQLRSDQPHLDPGFGSYALNLSMNMQSLSETMASPRILESLRRFDNSFRHFQSWQNWRWLIFDFLAPVIAGGTALILLLWPFLKWAIQQAPF